MPLLFYIERNGIKMDKKELIEKIRKLLALSDSSNPNEAALALSRAQKLMQKYSIEKSELSISDGVSEIEIKPRSSINTKLCLNLLVSVIKKSFGIEALFHCSRQRIKSVTFIGPSDILESCEYIFVLLSRQTTTAIKRYRDIIYAEVFLEILSSPQFTLTVATEEPYFYKEFYENLLVKEKDLRNTLLEPYKKENFAYLEQISSKLERDYKKYIKNTSLFFENNFNHIVSVMIRRRKKGFIRGYFLSISRKIEEFSLNSKIQEEINLYIENKYPSLVEGRNVSKYMNASEYDAYKKGITEGDKVEINSAIKNNAVKKIAILKSVNFSQK